MPSGITHIFLTKKLQDELPDGQLKDILAYGSDFLLVGSVAPDLPYASVADDDFFLTTAGPLADKFHYEQTNQVPLQSLIKLKSLKDAVPEESHYQMFSFFMGYISHVLADGILHPFIRDKVGNYADNKSAHRSLELQLDVLYLDDITKKSGYPLELNYTDIQDELLNYTSDQDSNDTIQIFSQLIRDVYNDDYSVGKINSWIRGLHLLFSLAQGEGLQIYRQLEDNTWLFKNKADIDAAKALILTTPVDRDLNFLHTAKIDFLQDCVPMFFRKFIPIAWKSFQFIYEDGPALTDADLPAIDLDTGRMIINDDLDMIPEFWK